MLNINLILIKLPFIFNLHCILLLNEKEYVKSPAGLTPIIILYPFISHVLYKI